MSGHDRPDDTAERAPLRWSSPGLHLADTGLSPAAVAEGAEREGAWVGVAELGRSKRDLLDALAGVLSLPAWFGRNWDALEECLGDLDRLPHRRRVLVLGGIDDLPPDDRRTLVELLAGAVVRWARTATPLSVVLCAAGPRAESARDNPADRADLGDDADPDDGVTHRAEGPRPNGEDAP